MSVMQFTLGKKRYVLSYLDVIRAHQDWIGTMAAFDVYSEKIKIEFRQQTEQFILYIEQFLDHPNSHPDMNGEGLKTMKNIFVYWVNFIRRHPVNA